MKYRKGEDLLKRKFILNADDFGKSVDFNKAVLEGYKFGILKSASLMANGDAFDDAVQRVIPQCEALGVGVHLNIMEFSSMLTGEKFNNSYLNLIIKSYTDKAFMEYLEKEFRLQIETVKNKGISISHIDSHVHTHAIPPIFELVCKLAKEYGIKQIRTQREKLYMIPDIYAHLNFTYPVNLIKVALLNFFTKINMPVVQQYGLRTNDYIIGVGYTSMMNNLTVGCGLEVFKLNQKLTVEALIHPCRYEDGTVDGHFTEFQITQSNKLKERINELGYEISNYSGVKCQDISQ